MDRLLSYGVKFEVIRPGGPVRTVKETAALTGLPESSIIKTLVFISERGGVAVIIPGNRRADPEKLAKIFGKVRLASAGEVLELTGFPLGGVPPFGHNLRTVVDSSLKPDDDVVGGGGDERTLIKVKVKDIIEVNRALVADVSI
ncbi:MAG: aminoacyl-tRNA deacylase [Candidatus Methanodesulfokora sp.]